MLAVRSSADHTAGHTAAGHHLDCHMGCLGRSRLGRSCTAERPCQCLCTIGISDLQCAFERSSRILPPVALVVIRSWRQTYSHCWRLRCVLRLVEVVFTPECGNPRISPPVIRSNGLLYFTDSSIQSVKLVMQVDMCVCRGCGRISKKSRVLTTAMRFSATFPWTLPVSRQIVRAVQSQAQLRRLSRKLLSRSCQAIRQNSTDC